MGRWTSFLVCLCACTIKVGGTGEYDVGGNYTRYAWWNNFLSCHEVFHSLLFEHIRVGSTPAFTLFALSLLLSAYFCSCQLNKDSVIYYKTANPLYQLLQLIFWMRKSSYSWMCLAVFLCTSPFYTMILFLQLAPYLWAAVNKLLLFEPKARCEVSPSFSLGL